MMMGDGYISRLSTPLCCLFLENKSAQQRERGMNIGPGLWCIAGIVGMM
jgi:hypothetical protein